VKGLPLRGRACCRLQRPLRIAVRSRSRSFSAAVLLSIRSPSVARSRFHLPEASLTMWQTMRSRQNRYVSPAHLKLKYHGCLHFAHEPRGQSHSFRSPSFLQRVISCLLIESAQVHGQGGSCAEW
jgi:hypothetical protein